MTRQTALAPLLALCSSALAQTDIDPVLKYAWAENVGWLNFADANDGLDGVIVEETFLAGFVWAENAGWIHAGDGPANGVHYANNANDHGVNIDPATGELFGYMWAENLGWINCDTRDELGPFDQQARVDLGAGRFRGYIWSENAGWINLDDDEHFVAFGTGCPADLDGDGDADADDFFSYLDAFAAGDLAVCDIDADGDCDADDFFGYLDQFAQGC